MNINMVSMYNPWSRKIPRNVMMFCFNGNHKTNKDSKILWSAYADSVLKLYFTVLWLNLSL